MKNFTKLLLAGLMLLFVGGLSAQTVVQIGTGTSSATTYGPIYASSSTSSFKHSKHVYLYTEADLAAAGIFPGSTITQVEWNKLGTGTITVDFKVYVHTTAATTVPASTLWSSWQTGSTTVYDNTALSLAAATGWQAFPFTSGYAYTGGTLSIMTQATWTVNSAALNWQWGAVTPNRTGYWNASTLLADPTMTTTTSVPRPNIKITYTPPPPCSGTPNAGTAASSVSAACPGVNFNLTLTGLTVGATFQWESSPAGAGTWTAIAGATGPSAVVSLTAATDYRCVSTCPVGGLSATSNTVAVGLNSLLNCYCATTYSSGCGSGDPVTNVTLNGLTNPTGCAPTFYTYFSSGPTTTLVAGSTYSIGISMGTDGNQYAAAWIDYNKNGTLETSECIGISGNAGASGTATLTFTVPLTASTGVTRLRVRGGNDSALTNAQACGTSSSGFGEAEDYDITIDPATDCSGVPTSGTASAPASACSGATFNLSLTGQSALAGTVLQWQKSPAGAGTWIDIAGATTATFAVSQTTASDYRCVVTCTNSGQSSNSNTVSVSMNSLLNCYCPTSYTSGCNSGDPITNVVVGTLTNASACSAGSYQYYSGGPTTNLQVGSTYSISITMGTDGNQYAAAWIDYNNDGVLSASECLGLSGNAGASGTAVINFTVPTSVTGTLTRLRVRGGNDAALLATQACGVSSSNWGEAEDYDITLDPPPPCTGTPASGSISGAGQICTGQTSTLTVAGYDPLGTITLQWKESTDNITFNNVGTGLPTYTTAALTGNRWYKVVVTCGASGQSSETAVFPVAVGTAQGGTVNGPTPITLGFLYTYNVTGQFGAIQWQSSTNGTTYTNITGATSATQPLTAGTAGTYYLRVRTNVVGCVDTAYSAPIIIVAQAASNDPVCGIVDVPVDAVNHGPYSNVGTSTQTGEPFPTAPTSCAGPISWCINSIENTVWFSFVAPASGAVKIESFMVTGSTDNQLALYSAPNCAAVLSGGASLIAANDDANSGGNPYMAAINTASCLTPGVTYYVQMDAYTLNGTGTYNIKISEIAPPDATFSGLPASVCENGSSITLTPVTAGGTFSGPGVTGSTFNPATAGPGTHTILYTLALPSLCSSTQTITVDDAINYYPDADGDGFGDDAVNQTYCAGTQPSGWVQEGGDCNDNNNAINPLATDVCNNGVDENCDGDDISVEGFVMDIIPDCKGTVKNKVTISGVSGGLGGYLYSKNGGTPQSSATFLNLVPGAYNFSVHAGDGCTLTQSLDIEPNMVLTPQLTNASCFGTADGAAAVDIAGGYAPFTYEWFKGSSSISTDESITDLVASSYKVNVLDSEGCLVKTNTPISQPPKITVKLIPTNTTCFGGTNGQVLVNMADIGGIGPFNFAWSGSSSTSNPLTGVPAGFYTATVTDLGTGALCTATNIVEVKQPKLLEFDTIKTKPAKCFGASNGEASAKTVGGTGTRTVTWSNGMTGNKIVGIPAGTYGATVTDDNTCTATASVQVTQPTIISIDLLESVGPINGFYDIRGQISGGTPTYKLASQMITPTLGDTSAFKGLQAYPLVTLKKLSPGTYKFFASDKNKCQVNTAEIAVPIVLKPAKSRDEKADLAKATNFRLVPNPTTSSVQLVFDGAVPTGGVVEVFSASGQLIQRIEAAASDLNSLRVENLPAGVLMVTYSTDNQRITKRLVVLN